MEKENINPKFGLAPSFPKDFTYESKLFYRKEVKCLLYEGWTAYYRCNNRKANCKANLILRHEKMVLDIKNSEHTCGDSSCKRKSDVLDLEENSILDVTDEIRTRVEELGFVCMDNSRNIAEEISLEFEQKYAGQLVRMLSRRDKIRKMILNYRNEEFGKWENVIKHPPLVLANDDGDKRLFLQFAIEVNIDEQLQKIIGWANPDLLFLARSIQGNLFFDCTFKIVPKGFSQLLIIMIYHPITKLYLPVFFILLQSKKYETYFAAIGAAIGAADFNLEGRSVTCDFEEALIRAITEQFSEADKVLCLFHWKQALRNKLVMLSIPKAIISEFMGPDALINILTVVEEEDIPKAVAYIRAHFDERNYVSHFDAFWRYFMQTWCKKYVVSDWNISEILKKPDAQDIIVNKTNNGLERLNRELNSLFPNPHPNMVEFVQTIRILTLKKWDQHYRVWKKLEKPPVREPVVFPVIPVDFATFVYNP